MKLRSQRDKIENLRDSFEALESKNKTWIFLQKIPHFILFNRARRDWTGWQKLDKFSNDNDLYSLCPIDI